MIVEIINLLRSHDFYGGSDTIEIAKGKRELVTTGSDMKRKFKRLLYLNRL